MKETGPKIGLIVENLDKGGIARSIHIISEFLREKNINFKVCVLASIGSTYEEMKKEGYEVEFLNLRSYHNIKNILVLRQYLKKERFDLIHTQGYFANVFTNLSLLFWRTKPVLLNTIHSSYWTDYKFRNYLIEHLLSHLNRQIIVPAQAVKDFAVSGLKINPQKISLVPNGAKISYITEDVDQIKLELGLARDRITVLSVGAFEKLKGIHILLDVARSLIEEEIPVQFLIVGGGPLFAEYKKFVSENKFNHLIKVLWWQKDIQKMYAVADIFVLPSIYREGMPLALLEACGYGLSLIATAVGGNRDVVFPNINGFLVAPGDKSELKQRIKELCFDSKLRSKFSENSKVIFNELFDYRKTSPKLLSVYLNTYKSSLNRTNVFKKVKSLLKRLTNYKKFLELKKSRLSLSKILLFFILPEKFFPKNVRTDLFSFYRYFRNNNYTQTVEKCPLCDSRKRETFGRKDGFTTYVCKECGHIYSGEVLNADGEKVFYSEQYFTAYRKILGTVLSPLEQVEHEKDIAKKRARLLKEVLSKNAKILEVGCGYGFFLKELKNSGFTDVSGIDLNPECVTYANKQGLTVKRKKLSELEIKENSLDAIVYLDVFEHLEKPVEELKLIRRILKPNGILLITTPDFGSPVAMKYKILWEHYHPLEHIQNFTLKRLMKFLIDSGFRILTVKKSLFYGAGYDGGMVVLAAKKNDAQPGKILIVREKAAGDVLETTPILKELKEKFPSAKIYFSTSYPEILFHNPHIEKIVEFGSAVPESDFTIYLNYELYPDEIRPAVYLKQAGILPKKYPKPEIYFTEDELRVADFVLEKFGLNDKYKVVVHTGKSTNYTRIWKVNYWESLLKKILNISANISVIIVGDNFDQSLSVKDKRIVNLVGFLNLRHIAAIVSKSNFVIAVDSVVLHMANAFGITAIGLFGATNPEIVFPAYKKLYPLVGNCPRIFCYHKSLAPVEGLVCKYLKVKCLESIKPEIVFQKFKEIWQQT